LLNCLWKQIIGAFILNSEHSVLFHFGNIHKGTKFVSVLSYGKGFDLYVVFFMGV